MQCIDKLMCFNMNVDNRKGGFKSQFRSKSHHVTLRGIETGNQGMAKRDPTTDPFDNSYVAITILAGLRHCAV